MPSLPDYREIIVPISWANIRDQIAALLYATGYIHDNEDVIDVDFDFENVDTYLKGEVLTTIKLKKQQQVEVLNY